MISMKELLEAGVHFGHQTKRWNPKMKPYIFGARNGIHVIDLQKAAVLFQKACDFVRDTSFQGKGIIFVGTKKQAQDSIKQEAIRCNMFYVNNRWLGGTLTNFITIKKSIDKLKELEQMEEKGGYEGRPKKEILKLEKQRDKLEKVLEGIKEMRQLPGAIFIVDSKKEKIPVNEAAKIGIPVIGVVDTNGDPDGIDYLIPGNDDAIKAIRFFTSKIAEAVIEGRSQHEKELQEDTPTQPLPLRGEG